MIRGTLWEGRITPDQPWHRVLKEIYDSSPEAVAGGTSDANLIYPDLFATMLYCGHDILQQSDERKTEEGPPLIWTGSAFSFLRNFGLKIKTHNLFNRYLSPQQSCMSSP